MKDSNERNAEKDPRKRLEQLIKSGRTIAYMEDSPDKDHPHVRWSVYGAPDTEELFVAVTNGPRHFVRVARSQISYPPMRDRIFGIDVLDIQVAGELTARMWRDLGSRLV